MTEFFLRFLKLIILGKVKTLSALNLDGNPLDQPPFAIIKQGIKSIQQYLRDQLDSDSSISSDEEEKTPRFSLRHPLIFPRKSKYFNIDRRKCQINSNQYFFYR